MANEPNLTPWPEIEKFPMLFCRILERYQETADAAALVIQRGRLGASTRAPAVKLKHRSALTRRALGALLCAPGGCAAVSEKLDGTNLGLTEGGELLGRRCVVPSTSDSYSKTDVRAVRAFDAAAFAMAVRAASATLRGPPTGTDARVGRIVLYGELMCNKHLYDYAASGHSGNWRVFGAVIAGLGSAADADACAAELTGAGFIVGRSGGGDDNEDGAPLTLALLRCDAFDAAVALGAPGAAAGARVALAPRRAVGGGGSVLDAIERHAPWMRARGGGEGLVFVLRDGGAVGGVQCKWKQAQEPAPAAERALRAAAARLAATRAAEPHGWVSPRAAAAVETLLAVATAPPPADVVPPPPAAEARRTPLAPTALAAAAEVALRSALTKFDTPSAYFARDGGRGEFTTALLGEVLADHDFTEASSSALGAGVDADPKARKQCEQHARKAVSVFVGKAYGEWKRSSGISAR